jgi:hypothetical protein
MRDDLNMCVSVRAIEETLLMLWMKVSGSMVDELPILLIMRLLIYKIKGKVNPSPIAPMVPKTIRNQSSTSACMKMDHIDPFLFLFFFLNKPINFLLSTPPILLMHPIFDKQTTV